MDCTEGGKYTRTHTYTQMHTNTNTICVQAEDAFWLKTIRISLIFLFLLWCCKFVIARQLGIK